jgi:Spy/CpxP family protein refolding chaperone
MKKILTGFLAIALSVGAAQAQTKDSSFRKDKRHHKEHRMGSFQSLNLSEEQKAKMKSLREDFRKQHDALKAQESTLTVTQMKERRKALATEQRSKFENIFTAEQKAQLAQMKKNGKAKGHYKGGKARKLEGARVADELNLTEDQKSRMAKLREDFRTQAEAIRKNSSLDKEAQKKALKQLHEKNKEQMKSVLTAEQIQKIESQRGKRPQKSTTTK